MYSCCCVDDGDYPDVLDQQIVVARKHHKCTECGDKINPGEKYERADMFFEGEWCHYKTCWFCLCVREDYFDCGWWYGYLVELFRDCNGWDYRTIPEDDGDY